ncbi:MAG: C factor, cell signaling protein [Neomegalonema sp.]|nr:C factor, cell signaling protein [Neomegalonema sp.]
MTSLAQGYRALVIGATGAIGGALSDALSRDPRCSEVIGLGRGAGSLPELSDEAAFGAAIAASGPVSLVLIATGALIIDDRKPEKRLQALSEDSMAAQFRLNTILPALAIKHSLALLPRQDRCVIAALSARVGSIEDNRLGGWTSYRAAKAALNQVIRCAGIELRRTHPQAVIAALHPGTVESPLSAPFRPEGAARPEVQTPEQSAAGLLRVVDGLRPGQSGGFFAYDGSAIPY